MKRFIKFGIVAVVLVVAFAVFVVYAKLNSIVDYVVETQGTQQTNLKTVLGGADVSLFGGEVELENLEIANPPGFTAGNMFSLGELDVKAPFSQLRQNPKRISNITIDEPKMVIERGADGKFNFKAAIDQMPKGPAPTEPAPASGEEMKLIIDELMIKEAVVVIRPGLDLPGIAKEFTVPIPTITMKNIGNADNAQNGAAMRDVLQQVITVLAANAGNSTALPAELRQLLSLDVNAVMAELGNRLGAEAQKRIAGAVPGELGQQLGQLVADPNALMKDPSKAVDAAKANLKGELDKKLAEQGLPTSVPSNLDEIKKDPGKAAEGLRGLLGDRKPREKKDGASE